MLVRLGPSSLGAVDHEQEEVDAGRAGDHIADEALVARHVDEREAAAVGQREGRVAEIDRDATRLLLGQPVGVLPRQRPDEPRLAVVDVSRGAYRERHARTARATSSASASVSVRQSSSVRPSRTRATTGGSPARSLPASSSSTAQAKLGSSASGMAPPPTRAEVSSTEPPTAAASRSARARTDSAGSRSMRSTGISSGRLEVEQERPLECRQGQLVRPERPLERVAPQLLDEVGASGDDAGLRSAEKLVAREADEVGAGVEAGSGRRLAVERHERT